MKPITILMLSIKLGQVGITKPMEIILTVPQIPQIIPYFLGPSNYAEGIWKRSFISTVRSASTLIRHQNGAYRKVSWHRRNLNTPHFRFGVDGKHFEHGSFPKRWRHDNHVISLNEFFSNTNPVIVAFLNSSGVVWTENFGLRFQSKTSAFKSGVLWTEPNQLFSFIFFVWSSTSGRQLSGEWRNHEMKFLISNPVNCSDPINKWNQHYSWISVNKLN